ncbi:Protein of unknown function [Bacillus cytotoxicus]|nr:Protein of unknown function [Bacillus cytotoxicus]SCN36115.1 Protein of unknown function [Bacillus cytotoxicus]
MIGSEMN